MVFGSRIGLTLMRKLWVSLTGSRAVASDESEQPVQGCISVSGIVDIVEPVMKPIEF